MNLLEALRYLDALEQQRHFGRAAQVCGITQPALSNAIRALEAEFGLTIVRRGRQYEGLSPAGELALAHGRRMLREAEALQQALASAAGAPRGRLQIGVVPTAVPIAALFAGRLQARQPGLRPVLRSLSSPEIEAGLEALSLDLGLGYGERAEVRARPLALWPQYEEHYFLVQRDDAAGVPAPAADVAPAADPPDAGLAFGAPLDWADAARRPLLLLSPDMHHRTLVDQAFAAAGCRPEPVLETNSVLALLVAVRNGPAAAVLPGALVGHLRGDLRGTPGLTARPLRAPLLRTPISFMTARDSPPTLALQAALALARQPDWLALAAAHSGALQTPAGHTAPDEAGPAAGLGVTQ